MQGDNRKVTTIGKTYEIIEIATSEGVNEKFKVIDDDKHPHWFLFSNYKHWFDTKKKIRKNKLIKLDELSRL